MTATGVDPAVIALGMIGAYDLVQNLAVPERAYVPANAAVTAGLVALALRSDLELDDLGLGRDRVGRGLVWGAATAAGLVAAGGVLQRRSGPASRWLLDARARGHGAAGAAYRVLVRYPIGTALFEEVAFRGVLDALWRRRGDRTARFVTAAAFGAWHVVPTFRLSPGMGPAETVASSTSRRVAASLGAAALAGVSGRGFTFLRERSGSLIAPWVVHAAVNAGSYLLARRAWRAAGDGAAGQPPATATATRNPT